MNKKKVNEQKQNNEQKQIKEEVKEEEKIEGPIKIFPEDNIEVISFTSKNIDLNKLRQIELEEHNYLHFLYDAPPLKLNDELNEMAQKYAKIY